MDHLLEKTSIISMRYEQAKAIDQFNVFTLLRGPFEEVGLHSRFLYELLNPKGSHQFGAVFLKLFLETIGIRNFPVQSARVHREFQNIDLLITSGNAQAIIIENKVWAGDQQQQLDRYFNLIASHGFDKDNIKIVYLTPDGREPSDWSLGALKSDPSIKDRLINISYKTEIGPWLLQCIKESSLHPIVRETITQYKTLVNQMTGNTSTEKEKQELIELIGKGDNAFNAHKIVENWCHVRWHTEWDFWNELAQVVSDHAYQILDNRKYSAEGLNNVIHGRRNRNPWYGIMFPISKIGDFDICIFIERGDGNLYYGVITQHDAQTLPPDLFASLAGRIEDVCQWKRTTGWLGGNLPQREINFEAFGNTDTLSLVTPQKRKEIIAELWQEIQEFIDLVRARLTEQMN